MADVHDGDKALCRTVAINLGMRSERISDRVKTRLHRLVPDTTAPHIHSYLGYGANRRFTIYGRVLCNAPTISSDKSNLWTNLKRTEFTLIWRLENAEARIRVAVVAVVSL